RRRAPRPGRARYADGPRDGVVTRAARAGRERRPPHQGAVQRGILEMSGIRRTVHRTPASTRRCLETKGVLVSRVLGALLVALLIAWGFAPLAMMLWRAGTAGGPSLWALWTQPETQHALRGTLVTSSGAAAMAFALGLPLAVVLERTDLPLR